MMGQASSSSCRQEDKRQDGTQYLRSGGRSGLDLLYGVLRTLPGLGEGAWGSGGGVCGGRLRGIRKKREKMAGPHHARACYSSPACRLQMTTFWCTRQAMESRRYVDVKVGRGRGLSVGCGLKRGKVSTTSGKVYLFLMQARAWLRPGQADMRTGEDRQGKCPKKKIRRRVGSGSERGRFQNGGMRVCLGGSR
jgi:hypothetical protein